MSYFQEGDRVHYAIDGQPVESSLGTVTNVYSDDAGTDRFEVLWDDVPAGYAPTPGYSVDDLAPA